MHPDGMTPLFLLDSNSTLLNITHEHAKIKTCSPSSSAILNQYDSYQQDVVQQFNWVQHLQLVGVSSVGGVANNVRVVEFGCYQH